MSGAEALFVVGIIANVIQLVDFSTQVMGRFNALTKNSRDVPRAFQDLQRMLPLLKGVLLRTAERVDVGAFDEQQSKDLRNVVEGCELKMIDLKVIFEKVLPCEGASRRKIFWTALSGMRKDKEFVALSHAISDYVSILTLHYAEMAALPQFKYLELAMHHSGNPALGSLEGTSTFDIGTSHTVPLFSTMPPTSIIDFIGRVDILERLKLVFDSSSRSVKIAVLVGMGGIGKTQLAMRYCHFCEGNGESVLWVNAMSEHTLKKSFGIIADDLSASLGAKAEFANSDSKVKYVQDWLRKTPEDWILVLDNYDAPRNLPNIRSYIPGAKHGKILITSRHPDAARLGTERITVDELHDKDAIELLLRRTGTVPSDDAHRDGHKIVRRLGNMPLAIDQASSYIQRQKIPLDRFLKHYEGRREHVLRHTPQIWEYRKSLSDEEHESALSVFTTWDMTFQHLQSIQAKMEIELINLLGYLYHESISEDLLQAYFEASQSLETMKWNYVFSSEFQEWDTWHFRDLTANLQEMFLIQSFTSDIDKPVTISLHPLVSDWIKLRQPETQRQYYSAQAICIVGSYLKSHFLVNASLESKQEILAHMDECVWNRNNFMGSTTNIWTQPLWNYGDAFSGFYGLNGRYVLAANISKCLLEDREKHLSTSHPEILRTVHELGDLSHRQGWYVDSEAFYNRALVGFELEHGVNHLITLATAEKLANLHRSTKRFGSAEVLYNRTLAGRQEQLGNNHVKTLEVLTNLAINLQEQGRFNEAVICFRRALACYESTYGCSNANASWIVNGLAFSLSELGQYIESERLFNEILAAREKLLGRDHVDTLWTVDDLANNYRKQGRYPEALELHHRALISNEIQLGSDHSQVLRNLEGLGLVKYAQGLIEEAEIFFQRALAGYERRLGKDDLGSLRSVHGLANVRQAQTRYDDAEALYLQALAGCEATMGSRCVDALDIMQDLAMNYWFKESYFDAERYMIRCLAGRSLQLGISHHDTVSIIRGLATLYRLRP